MALQGTLDTFALIDVLRLLSSTKKTGRLRVSSGRGSGSVWLDGGGVVAAGASGAKTSEGLVTVVFELLRYKEGAFVFEADVTTPDAGAPSDVESLVREAERLLAEWYEIEAVVPSVDCWVSLSPTLPRPEVVIDADRWRIVVATGAGATVAGLGEKLGLGEIAVSKAVKDVIEVGLAVLSEAAPAHVTPPPTPEPDYVAEPEHDHEHHDHPLDEHPGFVESGGGNAFSALWESGADPFGSADKKVDLGPEHEDLELGHEHEHAHAHPGFHESADLGIEIPGVPSLSAKRAAEAAAAQAAQAGEPVELPNLTPQAARAIAAAAQATTEAERDAALAQATGADNEPLDRGLLLRFLSSVKQ